MSDYAARDWVSLLVHWQTYGLIVFGLTGLFLTQNAFHAGPLAASQSTLVLVDPLVSILIGIALYGDSLRTSGPWGPLEAISLLVMFMGAVFLSHSPLVTGLQGRGQGRRVRAAAVPPGPAFRPRRGRTPTVPEAGLPPSRRRRHVAQGYVPIPRSITRRTKAAK